jgi:hypothetical protein
MTRLSLLRRNRFRRCRSALARTPSVAGDALLPAVAPLTHHAAGLSAALTAPADAGDVAADDIPLAALAALDEESSLPTLSALASVAVAEQPADLAVPSAAVLNHAAGVAAAAVDGVPRPAATQAVARLAAALPTLLTALRGALLPDEAAGPALAEPVAGKRPAEANGVADVATAGVDGVARPAPAHPPARLTAALPDVTLLLRSSAGRLALTALTLLTLAGAEASSRLPTVVAAGQHREAAGSDAIEAAVEQAVAAVVPLPAALAAHHPAGALIVHEAASAGLSALALGHPAATAPSLPSALSQATADRGGGVPLPVSALAGSLPATARSLAGPTGALLTACVLTLAGAPAALLASLAASAHAAVTLPVTLALGVLADVDAARD